MMREVNWHTIYITILSQPDSMGNQEYVVEWMDDSVGRRKDETGLKASISAATLKKHL